MAKKRDKGGRGKKIIAGTLITAAIAGAASWWTAQVGKNQVRIPTYSVKAVLDGDTFTTSEGHMIRLASLDAPESDLCGSVEAKKELEKLIVGKPIYLKVLILDRYKRMYSLVYTSDGLINEKILRSGWARMDSTSNEEKEKLVDAGNYAREHKLGINGPPCLSEEPDFPGCDIKGNVRRDIGTKIYILPGCQSYPQAVVQKDQGDGWFCTEAEAVKAGFKRSGNCHSNIKR